MSRSPGVHEGSFWGGSPDWQSHGSCLGSGWVEKIHMTMSVLSQKGEKPQKKERRTHVRPLDRFLFAPLIPTPRLPRPLKKWERPGFCSVKSLVGSVKPINLMVVGSLGYCGLRHYKTSSGGVFACGEAPAPPEVRWSSTPLAHPILADRTEPVGGPGAEDDRSSVDERRHVRRPPVFTFGNGHGCPEETGPDLHTEESPRVVVICLGNNWRMKNWVFQNKQPIVTIYTGGLPNVFLSFSHLSAFTKA